MSSKNEALEASIYSRSGTFPSRELVSPCGARLHLKRMETLIGEQGGTPQWWADVMDQASPDIPHQKQAAGTTVAHSLHGQDQGNPD
jgi:hypothetical protein